MSLYLPTLFVTAIFVALFVVLETRRSTRLRHLERAERIRMRASGIRHRLVMLAGAGEIGAADRAAFEFIYRATTMLLRFPSHYRIMSDSMCKVMLDPDPKPSSPPLLRFEEVSEKTRALLVDTDEALDAMIDQFSHPLILAMAAISGSNASRFVADLGFRSRIRQIERERKALDEWRTAASAALGAGSAA